MEDGIIVVAPLGLVAAEKISEKEVEVRSLDEPGHVSTKSKIS